MLYITLFLGCEANGVSAIASSTFRDDVSRLEVLSYAIGVSHLEVGGSGCGDVHLVGSRRIGPHRGTIVPALNIAG